VTDVIEYKQFIGGDFVASASGETLDVVNPAQDQVIARVPKSGAEDVDRAVQAAAKAFESWGKTTPQDRSLILLKIADALEAKGEEMGRLESRNAGKVTSYAIDEMAVCVDLFRFFAGACRQMEGKAVTEYLAGHTSLFRRDPIGVVASIAPWNYPLMMMAWKLAPALLHTWPSAYGLSGLWLTVIGSSSGSNEPASTVAGALHSAPATTVTS